MSTRSIIPDPQELLQNTVGRGLINAQELEFVERVAEELESRDAIAALIHDASKLVGTEPHDRQEREVTR